MDIQFVDPENVPKPQGEVRIEKLVGHVSPDGWRVRVTLDVTPFQVRPNIEVYMRTADGREVAYLTIIETMHKNMEFTIHVRGVNNPNGAYTLAADLYYDDRDQVVDHAETPLTIAV